jgi:enamine deaminase RidA (YjgF/YER057c/UK114 family)
MLIGKSTVHRLYAVAGPDGSTFITAIFDLLSNPTEDVERCYRQISDYLNSHLMTVVQERIFGRLTCEKRILETRRSALTESNVICAFPTFIDGSPLHEGDLAGILIRAAPKEAASPVLVESRIVGATWRKEETTFVVLQGITGKKSGKTGGDKETETKRMLDRAAHCLGALGLSYENVIRTWFYLSDILSWYDEFNAGRSARYKAWSLVPSEARPALRLPASTGIGVDNAAGASGVLDLLALNGPDNQVSQLSNPGQKDAFQYGSAFSRGALITLGQGRLLELSGTASIDETGASIHLGDPAAQIGCTFSKIETLLAPLSLDMTHLAGGVAFLKNVRDRDVLLSALRERGYADLPLIPVHADVCRDDLLFEIDGEFVKN